MAAKEVFKAENTETRYQVINMVSKRIVESADFKKESESITEINSIMISPLNEGELHNYRGFKSLEEADRVAEVLSGVWKVYALHDTYKRVVTLEEASELTE